MFSIWDIVLKNDGISENKNTVAVIERNEHFRNVKRKCHVTMTTEPFHQVQGVWNPKAMKQDPGACSHSQISATSAIISDFYLRHREFTASAHTAKTLTVRWLIRPTMNVLNHSVQHDRDLKYLIRHER